MSPGRASADRSVLVGSDLSAASDRVVRDAARFAAEIGADLHVVSAFGDTYGSADASTREVPDAVLKELRDALAAQLRRVLPETSRPASGEVSFGRAPDVILRRAREVAADVIVLGPHRGPGVQARYLGTTADAVLAGSTVPCLIVPPRLPLPLRLVGVAVDLADSPLATLGRALDFADRARAGREAGSPDLPIRVVILHVARDEDDVRRRSILDRLDQLRRAGEERDGPEIELTVHLLLGRDPADEIVSWAYDEEADLVVVGTRDRPRVQGSHLGSVSSAVARRARCPVLLIPPAT